MERQEMFDTIVKKLIKQKTCAVKNGLCRYYFEDDNGQEHRCSIGWLLPKKIAKQMAKIVEDGVDDGGISEMLKRKNIKYPDWLTDKKNSTFLNRLQAAHDNIQIRNDGQFLDKVWIVDMNRIARDYKLKSTVLDNLSSSLIFEGVNANQF